MHGGCDRPYPGFPNEQHEGCTYVDETFSNFVLNTIQDHDPAEPLFLFWAPHIVHSPLQVPKVYYDKFSHIPDWRRRRYHAMVNYMDARSVTTLSPLLKRIYVLEDAAGAPRPRQHRRSVVGCTVNLKVVLTFATHR